MSIMRTVPDEILALEKKKKIKIFFIAVRIKKNPKEALNLTGPKKMSTWTFQFFESVYPGGTKCLNNR